jgi:hypothetical protein
MSHRRILPIALALVLFVSVFATTASTASTHSSGNQAALVRNVPETQGAVHARSAGIGIFLRSLVSHVVHRTRPIVARTVARRVVRKYAWEWTKWEAVQWYCGRWDAYFGYDRSNWYWAAHYYQHPNWAWHICARYGYLG